MPMPKTPQLETEMSQPLTITAVQKTQTCLDRIAQTEPDIHAWEFLDGAAALQAAAQSDRTQAGMAMHGWIVGVKDNHNTADMPTGYGSPIYRGHRPIADCSVVSRLRSNGAVVLGKTVSTEFAAWPPSRTRNPRNLAHTPGGSSSGSAAAVAAGMVPVAVGTQTLGSVIRPASYCGIVGFKPSYERVSRVGIRALADSLDTVGIFATNVADAAHVYRVLANHADSADNTVSDSPPQLAFCKGPSWWLADDDARSAIQNYITGLREKGHVIEDIELPASFNALPAAAKLIHDFEMRHGFLTEYIHHRNELSDDFLSGFERASDITIPEYEAAIELGDQCRQQLPAIVGRRTALLTLAATGEAPLGYATTGNSAMNAFWTLLHAPCITLPKLHGKLGLPIGLQVVAPRFKDLEMLRAAAWLEKQ